MDDLIQKEIDKENEDLSKEIFNIGNDLIKNSNDIEEAEKTLSDLLESRKELESKIISIGLSSFSLPTGEKIKLNNNIGVSVINIHDFVDYVKENEDPILNKVGHSLSFKLGKEDASFLEETIASFIVKGIPLDTNYGIHAATLKSYISKKYEEIISKSEKKTIDEREEEAQKEVSDIPGIKVSIFKNVKLQNFGEKKKVFKRVYKK